MPFLSGSKSRSGMVLLLFALHASSRSRSFCYPGKPYSFRTAVSGFLLRLYAVRFPVWTFSLAGDPSALPEILLLYRHGPVAFRYGSCFRQAWTPLLFVQILFCFAGDPFCFSVRIFCFPPSRCRWAILPGRSPAKQTSVFSAFRSASWPWMPAS